MEKVFWLMWMSDVVGSIGVIGAVALVVFGLTFVAIGFIAGLEDGAEMAPRTWRYTRWLLIPIAIASVTPNSKTIQLLAVTAAADAAANTLIGAKGLEALNAILDRVIAEAKKK